MTGRLLVGVRLSSAQLWDILPHTAAGATGMPPADLVIVTDADANAGGAVTADLRAVMVAARTSAHFPTMGVVADASLATLEPYNIAREIGTLDIMTDGRAGLALQTPRMTAPLRDLGINYTEDAADPGYIAEAIAVIRALWRSWEPDAIIRDWETGRFLDADKVHALGFVGEYLRVQGPSGTPASPQGEPPIFWMAEGSDPVPAGVDVVVTSGLAPETDALVAPLVPAGTLADVAGAAIVIVDATGSSLSTLAELRALVDATVPTGSMARGIPTGHLGALLTTKEVSR